MSVVVHASMILLLSFHGWLNFRFMFEKDTSKLTFNTAGREFKILVIIAINKDNIDNVVSNVSLTFHLFLYCVIFVIFFYCLK